MIESLRLKLIACNKMHFEAALQSHDALATLLGVSLAEDWLIFPEAITGGLELLKKHPENIRWATHLFILKEENKLIGNGGFTGKADENGIVGIGYAISPEYQNRGLAGEAAQALIDYAFEWAHVKAIEAHTLAEENASCRVLQKCGMEKIGEMHSDEDGDIWHWRILREQYESHQS